MDFIFIDDMRVEAHVGIYDRERVAPQTLDLSLTFAVSAAINAASENLCLRRAANH